MEIQKALVRIAKKGDTVDHWYWRIESYEDSLAINISESGVEEFDLRSYQSKAECLQAASEMIEERIKEGYEEDADFDFESLFYIDDEEIGVHRLTSHPKFRSHFVDEFYYDCSDEEAPFGSDEGSDTLAELQDSVQEKGDGAYAPFPKIMIEDGWGMKYISVDSLDEDAVKALMESEEEMDMQQSDMVTFASAFAQIKITGEIDEQLKTAGILTLKRFQIYMKLQGFEDSETQEKMLSDLSAFDNIRK